MFTPYPILCGW